MVFTYHIQIRGIVNEAEINVMSPLEIRVVQVETAVSTCTTRTDQSGLIGLLRYLHGLGFELLSVSRNGRFPLPSQLR